MWIVLFKFILPGDDLMDFMSFPNWRRSTVVWQLQIVLLMGGISKKSTRKASWCCGTSARNKTGSSHAWWYCKTAGTKNNLAVPYQVAYCALNEDILQQQKSGVKNFRLIVPYLQAMIKANEKSVIGFTRGVGFDIMGIRFFPSFVYNVLTHH